MLLAPDDEAEAARQLAEVARSADRKKLKSLSDASGQMVNSTPRRRSGRTRFNRAKIALRDGTNTST